MTVKWLSLNSTHKKTSGYFVTVLYIKNYCRLEESRPTSLFSNPLQLLKFQKGVNCLLNSCLLWVSFWSVVLFSIWPALQVSSLVKENLHIAFPQVLNQFTENYSPNRIQRFYHTESLQNLTLDFYYHFQYKAEWKIRENGGR